MVGLEKDSKNPVDQPVVEVDAAQKDVAAGRDDFEHPIPDLDDRHVEGAAAEVEDRDGLGVDTPRPTPKARAAAVGSLMIRRIFRPTIWPASFTAWRWRSLKYAGTVTTARSIGVLKIVRGDGLGSSAGSWPRPEAGPGVCR